VRLQQQRKVVATVALTSFVIGGLGSVAIGLLIGPMMTDMQWPNSMTSSAATAFNGASLLATPAVGMALDKWGARAVMALGVLAASCGLLIASRCHAWYPMLAAFAVAGIGYSASFYLPSTVVVTSWMSTQRSLGVGIVMGAASAGAAMFSPLIGWWIQLHGWRIAVATMAVLMGLTLLPILSNIKALDAPWSSPAECSPANSTARHMRRDAMLSPAFMCAILISALFSLGMGGVYYHVVPVLLGAGYSSSQAGMVFGATWLLSALGSLFLGATADRFGAKPILALSLLSLAIGTLFLLGVPDPRFGLSCVLAFTFLWGTSANGVFQFVPALFADRFGTQHLGTLVGVQSVASGIAGAAAPIITGVLYDRTGGYRYAICLSASTTLLAFFLALLFRVDARAPIIQATLGDK
jgi:MFS family permease